jgi:hypothetical protein
MLDESLGYFRGSLLKRLSWEKQAFNPELLHGGTLLTAKLM